VPFVLCSSGTYCDAFMAEYTGVGGVEWGAKESVLT
jgi:hypothetical protein